MSGKSSFEIAVLPGDGIGVEVTEAAVKVLRAVEAKSGSFALNVKLYECGAECYRRIGNDLPDETLEACKRADAVLLGAMGNPQIRKADGTEINPQVTLRVKLDLFAGVRPCKLFPGVKSTLAGVTPDDIDFVIIREQTEGLFASQNAGIILHDELATDTLVMTRKGVQRVCDFAFRLAQDRERQGKSPKVTCVDKANIFRSYAFFRKIFDEAAARYPHVQSDHAYIDAQALYMVQRPSQLDVLVTENMFGDILSDLAAGLIGGMGMAPSADIGEIHGVFQPAHGTAPDIAGKGIANPIAAILSAGMMLDWLGKRHAHEGLVLAAVQVEKAVGQVLAHGDRMPVDLGGDTRTGELAEGVVESIVGERAM